MARDLVSTSRTGGVAEVLEALFRARAYNGTKVSVALLMRQLPPHTSSSEVTTILGNQVTASRVATTGGNYGLTAAGLAYLRANKPRGRV